MPARARRLEDVVALAEIERDRTPAEFVEWCGTFLDTHGRDRSFRRQILMREGIAKPLYEEVFPLFRLLAHKESEWAGHRFRNVLGNQPYDVTVTPPIDGAISHLEITVADKDRDEALRMEYFSSHSSVSALGPVRLSGGRRDGRRIEVENVAMMHSDVVAAKRAALSAAITRKAANDYGGGTGLLVYFDDAIAFADTEDARVMVDLLAAARSVWMPRFAALFVVGSSGKRFWEDRR